MSKFCANCGAEVSDGYAFCEKCGTPVNNAAPQPAPAGQPAYNQPYGPAPVQEPGNGMATAGFVVSLVSFLCCTLGSPVGLILSIVGMTKAKNVGGKGKGLAIAGIILGALGILAFIISLIATILNPEFISEINY